MAESRKRRIVKRLAVALAAMVLLFASYVGWWCLHHWGRANTGARIAPPPHFSAIGPLFIPLDWYSKSDFAGSDTLYTLYIWSLTGGELSWKECHGIMLYEKGLPRVR